MRTTDFDTAVIALEEELKNFDSAISSATQKFNPAAVRATLILRRGEGTTKYLLAAHIPALLERYVYAQLVADDKARKGLSKHERAERFKVLKHQLSELLDRAASEDYVAIESEVRQLLADERLIAPPKCLAMKELLIQVLGKLIEVFEIKCNRLQGVIYRTPALCPPCPRNMPTMLTLFENWSKGQPIGRTKDTYRGFVAEFEGVVGALPVSGISPFHADALRDHLILQGLSRGTVYNYLTGLATLVGYGHKSRALTLGENVFSNVNMDMIPAKLASEVRRPFEVSELRVLFNSSVYVDGDLPKGQVVEAAYWAPLLAIFAGLRIEEAAQLRMEDIQKINGVWALRISNLDPEQGLKTQSSFRLVPVHEELIKCGFLAYVAEQKLAGHHRLFPSLSNKNKNGIYSNSLGKWFSRNLDKIGLDDDRVSFHSLRYSFKQRCLHSGIDEIYADALSGHWLTKQRSGRRYYAATERQLPFPLLVCAIKKLRYDELDLSHLYVASPMKDVDKAFPVIDLVAHPVQVRRKRGRRQNSSSLMT